MSNIGLTEWECAEIGEERRRMAEAKKIKTKMTVTTATKMEVCVQVSGKMIVEMLRAAGHEIPPRPDVFVQVPGGGDWSNTALDVDDETPVTVRWRDETVETEETEEDL